MYLEMHGSWLSCLQTYDRCWVLVSGPSFPGNWMCPILPRLPPESSLGAKLMVAGREGTQSTLPSPPHMQLPSFTGRLESTLRGEAKALALLGHGC